jgi:hypothetical protein
MESMVIARLQTLICCMMDILGAFFQLRMEVSNEASTSQTNEVRWFPAGGEFGQTIMMMVWHFVRELVEDYNFYFY